LNWHGFKGFKDKKYLEYLSVKDFLLNKEKIENKLPGILPDDIYLDKVVFIGSTSITLLNLYISPLEEMVSNTEIQALAFITICNKFKVNGK